MASSILEEFSGYLANYEQQHHGVCEDKWGRIFSFDVNDHHSFAPTLVSSKSTNTKVLLALSYVTQEMRSLNLDFKEKILPKLPFLHLDDILNIFNILQITNDFVSYSKKLIHNVLNQLFSVYSSMNLASHIHFQTLYKELGSLLSEIAITDQIFKVSRLNKKLTEISLTLKTKESSHEAQVLLKLIQDWNTRLISGNMFNELIKQDLGDVFKAKIFGNSLLAHIKNTLDQCGEGTPVQFLETSCLILLYKTIFPSKLENRLLNKYWEMAAKHFSVIHIAGDIIWLPEKFMVMVCDIKKINSVKASRNQFVNASVLEEYKSILKEVQIWKLEMNIFNDELFNKYKEQDEDVLKTILNTGISLAYKIKFKTALILNLHKNYCLPLAKSMALKLFQSLNVLKVIQRTYKICLPIINKFLLIYGQKLMSTAQLDVKKIKKASFTVNSELVDLLNIAEQALNGPPITSRLITARLAITLAGILPTRVIKDIQLLNFGVIFRDLDFISQFRVILYDATNTSFFYTHRELLSTYLEFLQEGLHLERIVYVLDILEDCFQSLPQNLQSSFEKEVKDDIHINLLQPLSRELETDIRLQVHSHLDLDAGNPIKSPGQFKDFSLIFDETKWSLFDHSYVINIKTYMESYMEKTFYTQTAVAPHDWKTYNEMKELFHHIFDLDVGDDYLPAKILDQGLDVLEIIKDIDTFVFEYGYNLNSQSFIQIRSKSKYINCIGILQIASSIRTHGMGIVNTTVNATYKFLRSRIKSYSQFLYEDQIKSQLKKDAKHFEEIRRSVDHQFPYERVENFVLDIKKLGMSRNSGSKLDKFRSLITQIGNAMGLVRTIRSGGLHFMSNAISFIPDLNNIPQFKTLCEEEKYEERPVLAGNKLDEILENITKKLGEKNEYFQLLISIFSKHVLDEKQIHLKNFYLMIPALTINFIEHSISSKENILRNRADGGSFTDDGFPMGIAYLLTLMKQWPSFESLNWFKSVNTHFKREEVKAKKDRATSDQKLSQTIALTSKRLNAYKKEFELLFFNLNSAKIFFHEEVEESESA
uniref:WASH complex subunit 4 n=2 Tax=Lepeophtheirus salmonis TaxID=72036 RepID=A0A0K2V1R6_LEPSM